VNIFPKPGKRKSWIGASKARTDGGEDTEDRFPFLKDSSFLDPHQTSDHKNKRAIQKKVLDGDFLSPATLNTSV
jgi:hypothetical protein